jgi:hypothetical protein
MTSALISVKEWDPLRVKSVGYFNASRRDNHAVTQEFSIRPLNAWPSETLYVDLLAAWGNDERRPLGEYTSGRKNPKHKE